MKISKIALIIVGIVLAVMVVVIVIFALRSKDNQPAATPANESSQETALPTPIQLIEYQVSDPQITDSIMVWMRANTLERYDISKKGNAVEALESIEQLIVKNAVPVSAATAIVTLEKPDKMQQLAIADLSTKTITTKFSDRLKNMAWQGDQQKLFGYALSATNEPYFLTTSLDAKDQKAIIKTTDTNATPLLLTDKALVYLTDKTIKKIDLEKKEVSDIAGDIVNTIVSTDGSQVAYTTDKGLFAITKPDLQRISVSQTVPAFYNWSADVLMFGNQQTDSMKITRWNSSSKQLLTLATIPFDDVVQSVEAAFEDKINNKLIYWTGGFLYQQEIPISKSQVPNKSQ